MRQVISETERLIIRNWSEEDIAPYAKIIGDPDVMKYIGDGQPRLYEEAVRAFEKYNGQIQEQGWARFAVELKKNNSIIGFCGYDHYNGELDFGWRLGKQHWGNGYATEAAQEVLRLGVEQFQFPRIVCISFKENLGSLNVMKKLGLKFEKEFEFLDRGTVLQYIHELWVLSFPRSIGKTSFS